MHLISKFSYLTFLFPSLYIMSAVGLPAPNTYFVIALYFLKRIKIDKSRYFASFIMGIFLYVSVAITFNVRYLAFQIGVLLLPILFYIGFTIKPISGVSYLRLLYLCTLTNMLLVIMQAGGNNIRITTINPSYVISDASVSAISSIIPFTISRVTGMYHENGPMVTYCMLFVLELIRNSIYVRESEKVMFRLSLIMNIFLILFTGSKLALIFIPIVFVVFITRGRCLQFQREARSRDRLILFWSCFAIVAALVPIVINVLSSTESRIFLDQFGIQGLSRRLLYDGSGFSFFNGTGLTPTLLSGVQVDSLSGFILYPTYLGIVMSSGIIASYATMIYAESTLIYILVFSIAFWASGSLLVPFYFHMLIASRVR